MAKQFREAIFYLLKLIATLVVGFFLLIFISSKIGYNQEVSFFKDNKKLFDEKSALYTNQICKERVISNVMIVKKEFNLYLDCKLQSIVFETSGLGPGRTDYVYIKDESKVRMVDECGERNGGYMEKLAENWHLCHGDWN